MLAFTTRVRHLNIGTQLEDSRNLPYIQVLTKGIYINSRATRDYGADLDHLNHLKKSAETSVSIWTIQEKEQEETYIYLSRRKNYLFL